MLCSIEHCAKEEKEAVMMTAIYIASLSLPYYDTLSFLVLIFFYCTCREREKVSRGASLLTIELVQPTSNHGSPFG